MRSWKPEHPVEPSRQEIRRLIQIDLNRGAGWSPPVMEHLTGCRECRLYADQMASLESHLTQKLPLAFPVPPVSKSREEAVDQVLNRTRRRPMNTRPGTALKRMGEGAALIAAVLALIWVFANLRPSGQPAGQPGGSASVASLPTATPAPLQTRPESQTQEGQVYLPTATPLQAPPESQPPEGAAYPDPMEGMVYPDINQRFSLQVPPGWEVHADGTISGPDGFFRTSYLSDMGSYQFVQRVCEAIANTPEGPSGVISLTTVQGQEACLITPLKTMSTNVVRLVVQVPTTQRHLRYLLIETNSDYLQQVVEGLKFLHPAPPNATLEPAPEFYNGDGPFGSGDHIPAWPPTSEPPAELTIEEHPIIEQSVDAPTHMEFMNHIPPEVLQKRAPWREPSFARQLEAANQLLEPFGTRLEPNGVDGQPPYSLYQSQELVLDEITSFRAPSIGETGAGYYDYALIVDLPTGESRLAQNEGITSYDAAASLSIPPVYLGEALLQVRWDAGQSQVQVLQDGEQIFAFATFYGVSPPVKGLWTWDGHWFLEVDGFLIQDGTLLNRELAYDEIFGWQLLNGRPFYFFRVGSRIGVSYEGQVLPVQYDDVPHYQCCEPAMFNNSGNMTMAWFYALKEGVWRYVEMGVYPTDAGK